MTRLVWLLRAIGTLDLLAFVAVGLPPDVMAACHAALGLGPLPPAPIVGYLARSVSLFYGGTGLLFWYLSTDIERYRPLISRLAQAGILFGAALLLIDLLEGLPWWWTLIEGPCCIGLAGLLWIAARDHGGLAVPDPMGRPSAGPSASGHTTRDGVHTTRD